MRSKSDLVQSMQIKISFIEVSEIQLIQKLGGWGQFHWFLYSYLWPASLWDQIQSNIEKLAHSTYLQEYAWDTQFKSTTTLP